MSASHRQSVGTESTKSVYSHTSTRKEQKLPLQHKVKVTNRISELASKSHRLDGVLIKFWKVALRLSHEKLVRGMRDNHESYNISVLKRSSHTQTSIDIDDDNNSFIMSNKLLFDYSIYQTVLAMISLSVLCYQKVLLEFEKSKRQTLTAHEPEPESPKSKRRTQLLGIHSAFLQFILPNYYNRLQGGSKHVQINHYSDSVRTQINANRESSPLS